MNVSNLPDVTDWFKPGLYIAVNPDGEPIHESIADSGYSARSEFVRFANKPWSRASAEGYRVVELIPIANLVK